MFSRSSRLSSCITASALVSSRKFASVHPLGCCFSNLNFLTYLIVLLDELLRVFVFLEREVLVYHSSSRSRNYDLTIPQISLHFSANFCSVLAGFSLLHTEFVSCFIQHTTSLFLQYRRHLHFDYQLLSWKLLTLEFVLTQSIWLSPSISSPFVADELSLLRLHSLPNLYLFPVTCRNFLETGFLGETSLFVMSNRKQTFATCFSILLQQLGGVLLFSPF